MPYSGQVVDVSNYTGQLTQGQVMAARAAGVGLMIIRLSLETRRDQLAIARQQIRACQLGQMPWQGYFWCYYDEHPVTQLRAMNASYRDLWAGYFGATLWLDDEDEETLGPDSYPWLLRAGRAAKRHGFAPGVYSRRRLWNGSDREVPGEWAAAFEGWPLWLAEYDSTGDPAPDDLAPFGAVSMLQSPRLGWSVPGLPSYDTDLAYAVN